MHSVMCLSHMHQEDYKKEIKKPEDEQKNNSQECVESEQLDHRNKMETDND